MGRSVTVQVMVMGLAPIGKYLVVSEQAAVAKEATLKLDLDFSKMLVAKYRCKFELG